MFFINYYDAISVVTDKLILTNQLKSSIKKIEYLMTCFGVKKIVKAFLKVYKGKRSFKVIEIKFFCCQKHCLK